MTDKDLMISILEQYKSFNWLVDSVLMKFYNEKEAAEKQAAIDAIEAEKVDKIDRYFVKYFPGEITNKELKKMFGISDPTIIDWRQKGILPQKGEASKERRIVYDKKLLINQIKDGMIKRPLIYF